MDTFNDVWKAVLDYCRQKVSATAFNLWINTIEYEKFEEGQVTLRCSNKMYMDVVVPQYGNLISEAFEEIMGFKVPINYTCNDAVTTVNPNAGFSGVDKHLVDYKNEQFTFENFIVGPSNRFAYAAAKAVASDPGGRISHSANLRNYNPLFIYGNSGLGKTHILNAICNEVNKNFPDMQIKYIKAEQFANEFIQSLQNKTTDEFHTDYRNNIDVFLIDDIQFIAGKTSTEEEFFHTFDALVDNGKQVVITSDRPPKEIQSLTDRLKSRFEDGLLADIQTPEYETRCAIIKRKATLLNFDIPDSVVTYIADNIKSNIRQLEGVTNKLYALCNLNDHTPTVALAQSVVKDVTEDTQPLPVTIQRIVEEVSRTTGISIDDIYSNLRTASISHARKVTFYIVRKVTNMSYEEIGTEFNKDHSTVMYNINKIKNEIEKNSKLDRQIKDIISNVKNNE